MTLPQAARKITDMIRCERCDGYGGFVANNGHSRTICPNCNGTGTEPSDGRLIGEREWDALGRLVGQIGSLVHEWRDHDWNVERREAIQVIFDELVDLAHDADATDNPHGYYVQVPYPLIAELREALNGEET